MGSSVEACTNSSDRSRFSKRNSVTIIHGSNRPMANPGQLWAINGSFTASTQSSPKDYVKLVSEWPPAGPVCLRLFYSRILSCPLKFKLMNYSYSAISKLHKENNPLLVACRTRDIKIEEWFESSYTRSADRCYRALSDNMTVGLIKI